MFRARRNGIYSRGYGFSATQAGAEIRSGAEVIEIRVKDGAATSVVLSTGEEINAKAIISNADPKRTLLKLVDPIAPVARFRYEAAALSHAGDGRQSQPRACRSSRIHGFERYE